MTGPVTLVVLFGLVSIQRSLKVLPFPPLPITPPGDHHIVDVDSIMPRPENASFGPEKPLLTLKHFDETLDVPDGEPRLPGNRFVGNPGILPVHICFGKDCADNTVFRGRRLDTAVNCL